MDGTTGSSSTTLLVLLILVVQLAHAATAPTAFVPPTDLSTRSSPSPPLSLPPLLASNPVGDFFSGMCGLPPPSLAPPPGVLGGTYLDPARDGVALERCYKASKDGWSAVDFHRSVDGRGSGLVSALSRSGKRFGAYNPLGWMSSDDYGNTVGAFLWFEQGGSVGKCPTLAGGNAAVFDYATGGPCFGSADLHIGPPRAAVMGGFAGPDVEMSEAVAGDLRSCKASVGGAYSFIKGWPLAGQFEVVEVEVYCNKHVNVQRGSAGGGSFWRF